MNLPQVREEIYSSTHELFSNTLRELGVICSKLELLPERSKCIGNPTGVAGGKYSDVIHFRDADTVDKLLLSNRSTTLKCITLVNHTEDDIYIEPYTLVSATDVTLVSTYGGSAIYLPPTAVPSLVNLTVVGGCLCIPVSKYSSLEQLNLVSSMAESIDAQLELLAIVNPADVHISEVTSKPKNIQISNGIFNTRVTL